MSNKEITQYLDRFPDDAELVVIVANPSDRKKYKTKGILFITDMEFPVICIDVWNETEMDEDEIAACEEDEMQDE